jgi:DNA-directed RNA polymerase alpha subunit
MTMEKGIEMVQRFGPKNRRTRRPPDPEWLQFMSTSEKEALRQKEWRETSLADTGLSVRVVNCLEEAGILTVDDLTHQTTESLLGITNFGSQTLEQCQRLLANLKLPHHL